MANEGSWSEVKITSFVGISEHQRTSAALWIHLHTAEVAGSIPHRPLWKTPGLQVRSEAHMEALVSTRGKEQALAPLSVRL